MNIEYAGWIVAAVFAAGFLMVLLCWMGTMYNFDRLHTTQREMYCEYLRVQRELYMKLLGEKEPESV